MKWLTLRLGLAEVSTLKVLTLQAWRTLKKKLEPRQSMRSSSRPPGMTQEIRQPSKSRASAASTEISSPGRSIFQHRKLQLSPVPTLRTSRIQLVRTDRAYIYLRSETRITRPFALSSVVSTFDFEIPCCSDDSTARPRCPPGTCLAGRRIIHMLPHRAVWYLFTSGDTRQV